MRQLIIVRKDLNMSVGKTAVQCCHASQAWLMEKIKNASHFCIYRVDFITDIAINCRIMEEWVNDIQKKTICGAKNKTQLMKVVTMAQELGLKENKDFFLIYDRCLTELVPEEQDESGGKTLTCIGFRPLDDDIVHKISKKYQLL